MKKPERIFLYTVLAILVFYVFLVDGNVESQEVSLGRDIRARSIEIVNDEGRSVVMLWADENGGKINIANNKGDLTFLVNIGADKNGNGQIYITNKDGTPIALMSGNDTEGWEEGVLNKEGTSVANMIADDYGGGMDVRTKDGNIGTFMIANESGGKMIINNKNTTPVIMMGVNESDNGSISFYNKYNNTVALMGIDKSDSGLIFIKNKYNTPVAIIGINKDDGGIIEVYNKSDKIIGSLP